MFSFITVTGPKYSTVCFCILLVPAREKSLLHAWRRYSEILIDIAGPVTERCAARVEGLVGRMPEK